MLNVGVGRTDSDRKEITMIRKKLTAVFYKNFPHLRPMATQEKLRQQQQQQEQQEREEEIVNKRRLDGTVQRTVSPTGVDSFPGSRSTSPVHYNNNNNNNNNNKSFKQNGTVCLSIFFFYIFISYISQ